MSNNPKPARSLAGIAGIVAAATLLSKVVGLVREQTIAAAFGVGPAVNAYVYAYVIPGFLLILLGGINGPFHSALVSVLSRRDRDKAAPLVETVTTLVTGGLLLVAIGLFAFAGPCIDLLAPGLEAQTRAIAVEQLRVMTPLAVLAGWIGIGFGTLSAANLYWLPSVSPLFSSLTIMGGIGILALAIGDRLLAPEAALLGGRVLALGTLIGAIVQWVLLAIAQGRAGLGQLRLRLDWHDPGVKEVMGVMGPATLSSGMLHINVYTDLYFASFFENAAAVMRFANLIVLTPVGIISNAILVPFLPVFSRLAAPERRSELKDRIRQGLVLAALTMLPLTALFTALSVPIVRLMYERFAWGEEESRLVAPVLVAYGLGMFFYLGRDILVRVFYALGDGATPFKISIANIFLNAVLDIILGSAFETAGLVFATIGVNVISMAIFLGILHRRLQGLPLWDWGKTLVLLVLASVIAGAGSWGVGILWERVLGSDRWYFLLGEVGLGTVAAIGIFAVALLPLGLPEADMLVARLRQRFGR